jgi:tRNA A37 threonylcarbamoyladenosine dehydratase
VYPIQFERTIMLIGEKGYEKLATSKVMIFGLGGVGSYTVEALARAGIGSLVLIDYDRISATNINRQIPALHSTIGRLKTEVVMERVLEINPSIDVKIYSQMMTKENCSVFLEEDPDYLVDAIDTMGPKIALLYEAKKRNIPTISSMGAGNKLDPTRFKIVDISKTHTCPVAKIVRKGLRDLGIKQGIKTVFSDEQPKTPLDPEQFYPDRTDSLEKEQEAVYKKRAPASISFVAATAGLFLASVVVNDLLKNDGGGSNGTVR